MVSDLLDDGVETILGISCVRHNALCTIGLNKGILSLDEIMMATLPLFLLIAGFGVLDAVLVLVVRYVL